MTNTDVDARAEGAGRLKRILWRIAASIAALILSWVWIFIFAAINVWIAAIAFPAFFGSAIYLVVQLAVLLRRLVEDMITNGVRRAHEGR